MELGTRHVVAAVIVMIGVAGWFAWRQQDVERAGQAEARLQAPAPQRDADQVVIYKWQDDAGTWNFTETPPPDGRAYTEIKGTPNVTTVPTVVPDSGPAIDGGDQAPGNTAD